MSWYASTPATLTKALPFSLKGSSRNAAPSSPPATANQADAPKPVSRPTASSYSYLGSVRNLFSFIEVQPREPWHLLEAESALEKWETSRVAGLSRQTAKRNLERYGPNMLPEAEPRSGLSIFLEQFNSLPVYLLGAAAALSLFTGGLADAVLIAGVVVGNGLIGYKTEIEAEKTIRSLQTMVRPTALVVREGELQEISTVEVTPGDLCVLRPGSYVPADGRLVEASHLSLDESVLTGESLPVVKTAKALRGENIPLGDRVNLVFMGTLVTGGEGLMVVVAIGGSTEIGLIQALAGEAEAPDTPLQRQLDQLGNRLVWVCCGLCGAAFGVGIFWGYRLAGDAPDRGLFGRRGSARRAARGRHHHPGPGHPGHAPAPRADPPPACGGDPGGGADPVPGQNRHHHQKRNGREGDLHRHADPQRGLRPVLWTGRSRLLG